MSNRTFAAQPSIALEFSPESKHQALRQEMAQDLNRSLGGAPEYGSNKISEYLKLADKDLRYATDQAFLCSKSERYGLYTAVASTVVSAVNTLAFGFNHVSTASAITAGLGVAACAYAEYKSRQLKNGIDTYIQRLDNA